MIGSSAAIGYTSLVCLLHAFVISSGLRQKNDDTMTTAGAKEDLQGQRYWPGRRHASAVSAHSTDMIFTSRWTSSSSHDSISACTYMIERKGAHWASQLYRWVFLINILQCLWLCLSTTGKKRRKNYTGSRQQKRTKIVSIHICIGDLEPPPLIRRSEWLKGTGPTFPLGSLRQ